MLRGFTSSYDTDSSGLNRFLSVPAGHAVSCDLTPPCGSRLSPAEQLDVGQIARQHQSEQAEQVGNDVDDEAGGLERVRLQLRARLVVAGQAGQNQQNSTNGCDHTQPRGNAGCAWRFSLGLQQFADGDGEAADSESEDNGRHTGPHPGQERAFVGEMVAGAVGVVSHDSAARYYSTKAVL